jgi:hypothetical protein
LGSLSFNCSRNPHVTVMENLTKKALAGVAWLQIVLAVLIFVPALSLTYWQGWLY